MKKSRDEARVGQSLCFLCSLLIIIGALPSVIKSKLFIRAVIVFQWVLAVNFVKFNNDKL